MENKKEIVIGVSQKTYFHTAQRLKLCDNTYKVFLFYKMDIGWKKHEIFL